VLATIVLVTGITLLPRGATSLIRVIPGWWRLLAAPALPAGHVEVLRGSTVTAVPASLSSSSMSVGA
jgi:hypothetical protein